MNVVTKGTPWALFNLEEDYIDFDKELMVLPDEGRTSVDARLTFVRKERMAYLTVATHNDCAMSYEIDRQFNLTWEQGIKQLELDGVPVPKELK